MRLPLLLGPGSCISHSKGLLGILHIVIMSETPALTTIAGMACSAQGLPALTGAAAPREPPTQSTRLLGLLHVTGLFRCKSCTTHVCSCQVHAQALLAVAMLAGDPRDAPVHAAAPRSRRAHSIGLLGLLHISHTCEGPVSNLSQLGWVAMPSLA